MILQVSNEEPWLFRVKRGWNPFQLCGDHLINHEIRILIKQPGFNLKKIRVRNPPGLFHDSFDVPKYYIYQIILIWVVVSNIFYFHPYLGRIPILMDWNHQPVKNLGWFLPGPPFLKMGRFYVPRRSSPTEAAIVRKLIFDSPLNVAWAQRRWWWNDALPASHSDGESYGMVFFSIDLPEELAKCHGKIRHESYSGYNKVCIFMIWW